MNKNLESKIAERKQQALDRKVKRYERARKVGIVSDRFINEAQSLLVS